jgi:hypothetical protein
MKLNVGVSKSIGTGHNTRSASCQIECEMDQQLLFASPEAFQAKIRQAYAACTQAVKQELERQEASRTAALPNGVSRPSKRR